MCVESYPPSREATIQSFDCRKEIPYIMYPMSFVPPLGISVYKSTSLPVPLRVFAGMVVCTHSSCYKGGLLARVAPLEREGGISTRKNEGEHVDAAFARE